MIFCQGWSWDHFLGHWSVKITKCNGFLWLLQQIRIFGPKLGVATGRTNPKTKKSFLFKKQQLCACLCVLPVVAPQTMFLGSKTYFYLFSAPPKLFFRKNRGRTNWRLASDTTKDFRTSKKIGQPKKRFLHNNKKNDTPRMGTPWKNGGGVEMGKF